MKIQMKIKDFYKTKKIKKGKIMNKIEYLILYIIK